MGCLLVVCLFSCLVLVIVVIARLWLMVSLFGLFCLGLVVYWLGVAFGFVVLFIVWWVLFCCFVFGFGLLVVVCF